MPSRRGAKPGAAHPLATDPIDWTKGAMNRVAHVALGRLAAGEPIAAIADDYELSVDVIATGIGAAAKEWRSDLEAIGLRARVALASEPPGMALGLAVIMEVAELAPAEPGPFSLGAEPETGFLEAILETQAAFDADPSADYDTSALLADLEQERS